ncbi:MAG TPA: hypothetical protein DCE81_06680 [Cytophagales bacterium]|nr:hypothetical protein [Cytophagales bacterium]
MVGLSGALIVFFEMADIRARVLFVRINRVKITPGLMANTTLHADRKLSILRWENFKQIRISVVPLQAMIRQV